MILSKVKDEMSQPDQENYSNFLCWFLFLCLVRFYFKFNSNLQKQQSVNTCSMNQKKSTRFQRMPLQSDRRSMSNLIIHGFFFCFLHHCGVCKKNLSCKIKKTAQNTYNFGSGGGQILINFMVYCDVQILSNDTNDIVNSTFHSKTMALLIIYMF